MIDNPKVIVMDRPNGSVAVAVTNGSSDFHDAIIMVAADNKGGDDFIDTMESALFYAAKRIIQLEKGGYSPPPEGNSMAVSGRGIQECRPVIK